MKFVNNNYYLYHQWRDHIKPLKEMAKAPLAEIITFIPSLQRFTIDVKFHTWNSNQ